MRVSIIGAGDINMHYHSILQMDEEDLDKHFDDIAMVLAQTKTELVVLPDRGSPFAVASRYKELGGPKVIGTVPQSDKGFGIKHLQEFIDAEIEGVKGKKIVDEIIDTGDWYRQDLMMALFADTVLYLGNSLGAMGELVYAYYLYKIFAGAKPGVSTKKSFIHPQLCAGEKIPFHTIVYSPFIKDKIPFEIEKYIESLGCKIFYVSTPQELSKVVVDLAKEASAKK